MFTNASSMGREIPFGAVVKIIGNSRRLRETIPAYTQEIIDSNFDFSVGEILEEKEKIDQCTQQLYRKVLDVASGNKTKTESHHYIEPLVICTRGPIM